MQKFTYLVQLEIINSAGMEDTVLVTERGYCPQDAIDSVVRATHPLIIAAMTDYSAIRIG
jgi:hypothetical protein